jgi:molybdopterin molybdotransferase
MISVTEARKIIGEKIQPLLPVQATLAHASGYRLAEDIYAAADIPNFQQSSMDGYAFAFDQWKRTGKLIIEGESAAGDKQIAGIEGPKAIRIFTGAPVPAGADTVVMQEKVRAENEYLFIDDESLKAGNNIRAKGSEIRQGELALAKGSILGPAAIGFLAGIGITHLKIYPKPSVTIIVTGNELQEPGNLLEYGQVYESNSYALSAALKQLGIGNIVVKKAKDKLDELVQVLANALNESELVLLTGGVSVGDYDYVVKATEACGVQQLFHKIKQRPGKPLYLGIKDNKMVFGLPGNPSSVLSCFYQYVIPAIGNMCTQPLALQKINVPLANTVQKSISFTQFLKAYFDGGTVTSLDAQESYRMHSFARANCMIELGEEAKTYQQGEIVTVHLLPS